MMRRETYKRVQENRFYVALSLQEAENLRGLLHLSQGGMIRGAGKAAIGLRLQVL